MARRIERAVLDGRLVVLPPGSPGAVVVLGRLRGCVFVETATLPCGARQRGEAAVGSRAGRAPGPGRRGPRRGAVTAGAETITFSGRLGHDPAPAIAALGEIVDARG